MTDQNQTAGETERKNAPETRGRPFQPGNPGRPKGALNKTTLAARELLDGEAEELTRKCIELAKDGDSAAMRLCMERIVPAVKSRTIKIELPTVDTMADVLKAQAVAIQAMAAGEITPDEAATIAGVLEAKRRAIETVELEARLVKLEQSMERAGNDHH
jgi:hypothetical protein